MSRNIIPTIGHHVFQYLPPKYTEKGAPVLSEMKIKKKRKDGDKETNEEPEYPFVGEGYYFWDNNIARAHKWGRQHCRGRYLIMESPLVLQGEKFLDLAGSREDMLGFLHVFKRIQKDDPNLRIGAFFYGMQKLVKRMDPDYTWPYTIIRVLNVKTYADKVQFNHIPDSYMLLDPEIIICFYDKNELNLQQIRYLDKRNRKWTTKE